MLGVNKKAPNLGVYGDSGRYPISFNAAKSFVKYWHRLANFNEKTNELLTSAYSENKTHNRRNSWYVNVLKMSTLISTNIESCITNDKFYTNKLLLKLKDTFKTGWKKRAIL